MPATLKVARNEIYAAFKAAWDAGAGPLTPGGAVPQVFYDGLGETGEKPDDLAWARIQIRHNVGAIDGIGRSAAGTIRTTKAGLVTVQVFQPLAFDGTEVAEDLAALAKTAFEGVSTASCVRFLNVTINEVGVDDTWYQINVVSDFEYEEFV